MHADFRLKGVSRRGSRDLTVDSTDAGAALETGCLGVAAGAGPQPGWGAGRGAADEAVAKRDRWGTSGLSLRPGTLQGSLSLGMCRRLKRVDALRCMRSSLQQMAILTSGWY